MATDPVGVEYLDALVAVFLAMFAAVERVYEQNPHDGFGLMGSRTLVTAGAMSRYTSILTAAGPHGANPLLHASWVYNVVEASLEEALIRLPTAPSELQNMVVALFMGLAETTLETSLNIEENGMDESASMLDGDGPVDTNPAAR